MAEQKTHDMDSTSSQQILTEKQINDGKVELDLTVKVSKEVTALDPGLPVFDQSNLLPFRQLMIVYAGLSLAMFLAALDQLIVATAVPKIVAEFSGLSLISWVFNAYSLTTTSLMPLYG